MRKFLISLTFALLLSGVLSLWVESQSQNFGGGVGTSSMQVQGAGATGAAVVGNPLLTGGKDTSGNSQPFLTSTTGIEVNAIQNATTDGAANSGAYPQSSNGTSTVPWVTQGYVFNGASWDRQGYCPNYVTLTQAASNTLQIIAVSGSTKIRVCNFFVNSANANTVTIEGGTGANCGSTVTNTTGAMNVGANGTITASAGAGNYVLITPASNELCLVTGAGVGGTTGGLMWGQW